MKKLKIQTITFLLLLSIWMFDLITTFIAIELIGGAYETNNLWRPLFEYGVSGYFIAIFIALSIFILFLIFLNFLFFMYEKMCGDYDNIKLYSAVHIIIIGIFYLGEFFAIINNIGVIIRLL